MKKLLIVAMLLLLPSCADATQVVVPDVVVYSKPKWTLVLFFGGEQPVQIPMEGLKACEKTALKMAPANRIDAFHSTPTASCISSNGEVYSTLFGKMVKQ